MALKLITLDANEIVKTENPCSAIAEKFGVQASTRQELTTALLSIREYLTVEVKRWQEHAQAWQELGDVLNDVQQRSDTFFLIWGGDADYLKFKSIDAATLNDLL